MTSPETRPLPRPAPRRPVRKATVAVAVAGLGAVGLSVVATSGADAAGVSGAMVTQQLSIPGGGAWLPDGGGHFWVSDGVLGLCETVPASLGTTKCNGTAKGGQIVYDAAKSLVYQTDGSTKTTQILRFPYVAASDALGGPTQLSVPNVTNVGGGNAGGRTQGVALVTGPDGVERLYVSYVKSGDVMEVKNPSGKDKNGATVTPAVTRIGSTSDGRGANALTIFTWTDGAGAKHDDLYVAEGGGAGLSVIKDVDGTAGRPACGATVCTATTVTTASGAPVLGFPSGLATDGRQIYVGDAPANTPSRVLTFNPVTGTIGVLSSDITPAYTAPFDGLRRTQYQNITGLAINPATLDVYVGDDPSAKLAVPVNAQGHLWKISGTATAPVVTGISPATGDTAGASVVTVTGTNLVSAVAGAGDPTAFGTKVSFGSLAGTAVSCLADGKQCTATSPAVTGAGVVDVRVTNAEGQISTVAAADRFTYTVAQGPANSPLVTAISPSTGSPSAAPS